MSFTVLENTPTVIDLAAFARTTGWEIVGTEAVHEACNDGFIAVVSTLFTVVTGESYSVAYEVKNYVSGNIRLSIGTNQGVLRTANGLYVETVVAGGVNPTIKFFATGSLRLRTIDVKSNFVNTATKKRNTFSFSETSGKWTSFLSFTSDFGVSIFKDLFTFKGGRMYRHDPSLSPRNNIYGVQYKTIINMPFNLNKAQPKTYASLSYESNSLLVTTTDGVVTSLGQVSGLISKDFLRETLDDGISQVDVYSDEGMFLATFVAEGSNQVDGSVLKGTWITVELITANDGMLIIKNVMVNSDPSKIGGR